MKRKPKRVQVIDSSVTVDDIFTFMKKEITKGKFGKYKNCTDEELLEIARGIKPIIEIQLEFANRLALEQLRSIKKKK